jgi:glutamyl/glutaminyl-tRNA synthetase
LELFDEGGTDLGQSVATAMGDPLVRRPDGGVTYQLAVVADDIASGVTRVVRGRDIAPSTATQAALWDLLGAPRPIWRHHLLLLEPRGEKLAKLHQSIGADELRRHYSPDQLRGFLGFVCGLQDSPDPVGMSQLVADFAWDRVARADRVVAWDGRVLTSPLK